MSGCETSFSLARCTAIANAGPAFWSGAFKAAHAGTNTVRLPIDAVAWLSNAGGQYQANYKKAVADALAGGLYVIIDQHWSAPNGQSSIGQPGFSDADHGLIFWKQMADLYGGNPAVIFELFNEPFGDNNFNSMVTTEVPIVANGGAFSPFMHQNNAGGGAMLTVQISYQVAGEKTMLAVIRGEGATNLVLASTMGWAGEMQTWLTAYGSVKDANFGASHHAYGWNYGGSVAARQAVLLAIQAAGYPIVTTEFTVGMPTIGGYAFESSHGIGSISWGPNAWGGKPTLSPTGW